LSYLSMKVKRMKKVIFRPVQILANSQRFLRALVVSIGVALAAQNGAALAQSSADGTVTVAPAIAVVDTVRHITISGNWHNACLPSTAEIVADPSPTPKQLTIRLNEIFTFAACAQVVTPFTYGVNYTPRVPGVLPIVVETTGGQKVAEGRLTTVRQDDAAATVNLTGAWFEAPVAKSLLMVSHSPTNPDALVGTWTLFDRGGQPTSWFFHSSLRLAKPNVYESKIYFPFTEATTEFGCNFPPSTPGCLSPQGFTSRFAGWLQIEVLSAGQIKVDAFFPHLMVASPALGFSTVLTRYAF